MKRFYSVVLAGLVTAVTMAAPALAAPRSPQIVFGNAALQARLASLGESISTLTDQQDGLVWGSTISSNSTMTIQFDLNGNPNQDEVGIVKLGPGGTSIAGICAVFPAAADSGWFAVASFRSGGNLIVTLFDQHASIQSQTLYTGVDRTKFGYYIKNPGGTFYSHDGFNTDGRAHALAYAGTGENTGSWWLCWEDAAIASYAAADFDDAVVFMESLNPTPVNKTSWGSLKQRFR